jgi:hypothetical protein
VDNWHCFSVVAGFQARPRSFEDSYLVQGIEVVKGWYVQRRESRKSGESQCVAKLFLRALAPGGGRRQSQKSKIKKSKIAKSQNRNFRLLPKKMKKLKKSKDRASLFDGYRRSRNELSAWTLFNTALNSIILALRYE